MKNPTSQQLVWKKRLERSTLFLSVLVINLVIVLFLASLVVCRISYPPTPRPIKFKIVVPFVGDPTPYWRLAELRAQAKDPKIVTPPPVSIVPTTVPAFNVNSALNSMTDPFSSMTQESGTTGGAASGLFGSFSETGNEFQGAVYDLKIDPNHQSTGMDQRNYTQLLRTFINKGWDARVLAPYLKASKPLFTSAIWIPTIRSEDCAKEMKLDDQLTSIFWVGLYHAKITPAQAGTYHFVGFGDDVLAVAVNGQLVLDASLSPVSDHPGRLPWSYDNWSQLCKWRGQNYGKLRVGQDFTVNSVEPVTIDILMGNEPGGYYGAFLMIADNSKSYANGPEKVPLYPIFQVGTDPVVRPGDQPPHSTTSQSWGE